MKKLTATLLLFIFLTSGNIALAGEFNPNIILTEAELTDYTSMNEQQIKSFLKSKNGTLGTYADMDVRMYAHQLIYNASRLYRINPKYILVLLQKEQSLITDPNPSQGQYDWATGYGCPDSGGCNPKYKGFANQVDWGTGAMRFYLDYPEKFTYQVGQTYTIDGQPITMTNNATRSLYTYTPHIHGNKNLHKIWQEWFSMSYPDGALLQNTEDGGIWLIQNGKRRPFLSKAVFASRYSFDKVVPVKESDLATYEIGQPIKYANYSLLRIPSGGVYLLVDDKLRPITSGEAFRLLGFNPEEIVNIQESEVSQYEKGQKIDVSSSYPTGALLQDNSTGGVYYVQNGVKHPIWDKALINLYHPQKRITAVTPSELEKYTTGDPLKLEDGELIMAKNGSQVFFISNGYKRPIANEETFLSFGYNWKDVIKLPQKVIDLHPTGETLNTLK